MNFEQLYLISQVNTCLSFFCIASECMDFCIIKMENWLIRKIFPRSCAHIMSILHCDLPIKIKNSQHSRASATRTFDTPARDTYSDYVFNQRFLTKIPRSSSNFDRLIFAYKTLTVTAQAHLQPIKRIFNLLSNTGTGITYYISKFRLFVLNSNYTIKLLNICL